MKYDHRFKGIKNKRNWRKVLEYRNLYRTWLTYDLRGCM